MAIIRDGLPNRDYHRRAGVSATDLKMLARMTPARYHYERSQPSHHKPAFDLGTAAHSFILERDRATVVKVDADDWRGKASREARDMAYADGMVPLLTKDYARVIGMYDSVMKHDLAGPALERHVAERSIFWEVDDQPMKCRPDALTDDLIIDLKTCVDASPEAFSRSIAQFGYHIQDSHYRDGVEAATGEQLPFVFLAVEKEPPYLVAWYELDPDDVERGREAAARSLAVYRECKTSGMWPGYPTSAPIGLPRWARFDHDDRMEEMEIH